MNKILNILLITSLLSSVFIACDKDETNPIPPVISSIEITDMTYQDVAITWDVSLDNSNEIIENGICWSISSNPTIENNKTTSSEKVGKQNLKIDDLNNNTEIFLRAYSITESETTYSDELSFTLWIGAPGEPVTDIDGNVYKTVKIGNQVWMQENLQVKHYNNGDKISLVTLDEDQRWMDAKSGMYCKYEDNDKFGDYYGFLYNGYAVTDQRKIAPKGYSIPSGTNWNELFHYLGGNELASKYLIMTPQYLTGTDVQAEDLPTKQVYNFGGLTSGWRMYDLYDEESKATLYYKLGNQAFWWYASGKRCIGITNDNQYRPWGFDDTVPVGLSIRCIKNSE